MLTRPQPTTAAEAFLMALKANGVDYLFANAGTDFAPVIEGLANQGSYSEALPEALVIPHETAAVAMPARSRSFDAQRCQFVHVASVQLHIISWFRANVNGRS